MSKINRRDFLLSLSSLAVGSLLVEEVSGQVKGFSLDSPGNNQIILYYSYIPMNFRAARFRSRQRRLSFPKINRINYKVNGTLVGSGVAENSFLYQWQPPPPSSLQGDSYMLTAEAIQSGTRNVIATVSVTFKVIWPLS
jgi:hypothetical protein